MASEADTQIVNPTFPSPREIKRDLKIVTEQLTYLSKLISPLTALEKNLPQTASQGMVDVNFLRDAQTYEELLDILNKINLDSLKPILIYRLNLLRALNRSKKK